MMNNEDMIILDCPEHNEPIIFDGQEEANHFELGECIGELRDPEHGLDAIAQKSDDIAGNVSSLGADVAASFVNVLSELAKLVKNDHFNHEINQLYLFMRDSLGVSISDVRAQQDTMKDAIALLAKGDVAQKILEHVTSKIDDKEASVGEVAYEILELIKKCPTKQDAEHLLGLLAQNVVEKVSMNIDLSKGELLAKIADLSGYISSSFGLSTGETLAGLIKQTDSSIPPEQYDALAKEEILEEIYTSWLSITHRGEAHQPMIITLDDGGRYDYVGYYNHGTRTYRKYVCIRAGYLMYIYTTGFTPYDTVYTKNADGELIESPSKIVKSETQTLAYKEDLNAIIEAIGGIKIPTDYAKQGDNPEATNSAILEAVKQGGGGGGLTPEQYDALAKEQTLIDKIGTPKEGAEYTTVFGAIEQLIGSLQDDWRAADAEAEQYFNS